MAFRLTAPKPRRHAAGRRTLLPSPWRRVDRTEGKLRARYVHPDGFTIRHCGHPTALWPYVLERHGRAILSPSGHHWRTVTLAALAVQQYRAAQVRGKGEP